MDRGIIERAKARIPRVVAHAAALALVAAAAFGAGLVAGGSGGSAAAVISRLPLVGDGLDATPDQRADLADFWKAWNALQSDFVITHASSSLPSAKDRVYGAIEGLAASYGDPYTVFFPPDEAKLFNESISGSFAGVGMEIGVKSGALTVIAPLKGTPAARAGVKAGDQILSIDGEPTDTLSVDAAVAKIRGPKGSVVELGLARGDRRFDLTITRDTIEVPETDDSFDAANGVYRISLYEFTGNSAELFSRALERFKASGGRRLILDLRGNPGGYLDAAVDVASYFLPKGAAIVTEDFGGGEPNNTHESLGYDDIPAGTKVVVLIDGGSASASEILAGALQDNRAATVIGEQSFGKGSVQQLVPIDGGALKVTIARWITPAGHWIMGGGITPDIKVGIASSTPPFTLDTAGDPQYARAVRFLTAGK